jgi:putative FmdB family regulatory protein
MPTYEYRCPKGHEFELFQRMSDEPKAECPRCGADSERLLSGGAGFLFKGDGFYITDYRSDSYKKEASKENSGLPSEAPAPKKAEEGPKKDPSPARSETSSSTSSTTGGSSSEGS